MKIIVTGSLGHISKPLTIDLVKKGHSVTVISSKADRRQSIEELGATAAIGTMQDSEFLAATFKGADVVYVMEALGSGSFFDKDLDLIAANTEIGDNYKKAIAQSGVKKVVHLSSIGAHMKSGNGILAFHYNVEALLRELPADVSIKTMRPVGFYYNMFEFIHGIKAQGVISTNYNAAYKEPWVSPPDIAAVISEEIEKPFNGREIRYIASDEKTSDEIATLLGEAIGKPDLKWIQLPDAQVLERMLSIDMNPETAKGLIEMNVARQNGIVFEDYNKHKPVLGLIKIKDFAKQFAAVYNQ